jgi:hypothetical protein
MIGADCINNKPAYGSYVWPSCDDVMVCQPALTSQVAGRVVVVVTAVHQSSTLSLSKAKALLQL